VLIYDQAAIRPRLVEDRLARYGAAVGMRVWPHRLRHTLATRLVNIGMDIVSIQHLLGHEKLETTMIYAHVYDATVEQDFRQAMARLSAAQTEPIPLEEKFFAHTRESVCTTTQAPNCV